MIDSADKGIRYRSLVNDTCIKRFCDENPGMPDALLYILIFIAFVIVYVIAKVLHYVRLSDQQWEQVDKSKLRTWDDDEEDWPSDSNKD